MGSLSDHMRLSYSQGRAAPRLHELRHRRETHSIMCTHHMSYMQSIALLDAWRQSTVHAVHATTHALACPINPLTTLSLRSNQYRLSTNLALQVAMRLEFLGGLWAFLGLASLPLACADATMNAWNQLMIDQLFAGFNPFVRSNYHICPGIWRTGEGSEGVG